MIDRSLVLLGELVSYGQLTGQPTGSSLPSMPAACSIGY
jgi:hypothetical protein